MVGMEYKNVSGDNCPVSSLPPLNRDTPRFFFQITEICCKRTLSTRQYNFFYVLWELCALFFGVKCSDFVYKHWNL